MIALGSDGPRVWDANTGKLVATIRTAGDAGDWVVWAPDGRTDGTPEGLKRVAGAHTPGLLAAVFGRTATAAAPAPVRFVSPERDGKSDRPRVVIEVEGPAGVPIALTQNGNVVPADGTPKVAGATQRATYSVALAPGRNRLSARAGAGGEPAELSLRYDAPGARGHLFVLAVGVSKYADEKWNLQFADADAKAVAAVFAKRATAGREADRLYSGVTPEVLTDKDATADNIRAKLTAFARDAKPEDTLLVHFSGHGVTLGQRYFFLPHEFRAANQSLEDSVRGGGFPAEELTALIRGVKAKNRVLILDTCESGGIAEAKAEERAGVFKKLDPNKSLFVITAAAGKEQAQEPKELKHGVLTYTLLACLHGVDHGPLGTGPEVKPHDRFTPQGNWVDVLEWFTYASVRYPILMGKYYRTNQPVGLITEGKSFPVLRLSPE